MCKKERREKKKALQSCRSRYTKVPKSREEEKKTQGVCRASMGLRLDWTAHANEARKRKQTTNPGISKRKLKKKKRKAIPPNNHITFHATGGFSLSCPSNPDAESSCSSFQFCEPRHLRFVKSRQSSALFFFCFCFSLFRLYSDVRHRHHAQEKKWLSASGKLNRVEAKKRKERKEKKEEKKKETKKEIEFESRPEIRNTIIQQHLLRLLLSPPGSRVLITQPHGSTCAPRLP